MTILASCPEWTLTKSGKDSCTLALKSGVQVPISNQQKEGIVYLINRTQKLYRKAIAKAEETPVQQPNQCTHTNATSLQGAHAVTEQLSTAFSELAAQAPKRVRTEPLADQKLVNLQASLTKAMKFTRCDQRLNSLSAIEKNLLSLLEELSNHPEHYQEQLAAGISLLGQTLQSKDAAAVQTFNTWCSNLERIVAESSQSVQPPTKQLYALLAHLEQLILLDPGYLPREAPTRVAQLLTSVNHIAPKSRSTYTP